MSDSRAPRGRRNASAPPEDRGSSPAPEVGQPTDRDRRGEGGDRTSRSGQPDGRAERSAGFAGDSSGQQEMAQKPSDISWNGWKAISKRVVAQLKLDHISLLGAGVAFKALLALFPALIAAVTIWGLVASEEEITEQIAGFTDALPAEAATLIDEQLTQIAGGGTGALSFALVISLVLALWSASSGMAGLIEGCNAAYNEVDERGFVKKRGLALLFTFGGIVFLALALGLIAVLPAVLGTLGLGGAAELAIRIAQWPVLALLVMGTLALIYKVGPDRDDPQMRWSTPGAIVATLLWLIGSALFTVYVENFGTFGETYGALAGVIILMLWLYLTSFVVLLGAEINSEMERETAYDTTVGEPQPMGRRHAVAADTTPEGDPGPTQS